MPLLFKSSLDDSQYQKTLKGMPAAAAKAGRDAGKGFAAEMAKHAEHELHSPGGHGGFGSILRNFGIGKNKLAAAAIGSFIGHEAMGAMQEFGNLRNKLITDSGGMDEKTAKMAQSWREMAVAANTVQGRVELQAKTMDDIQANAEKFRSENVIQGSTENAYDLYQRMTGGQTIAEHETESFQNRQATLENFARSNAIIAKRREEFLSGFNQHSPGEKMSGVQRRIDSLMDEQAGLGDPANMDAGKLRHYQRLAAEIKSLEPHLSRSRGLWQAQVESARQMVTPVSQLRSMEKERADIKTRMSNPNLTQDERSALEGRANQLDIGIANAGNEKFFRKVGAGLMGAGGRRDVFRQHMKEEREINRQNRVNGYRDESGRWHAPVGREARAFSGEGVTPKHGIEAERDRRGNELLGKAVELLTDIRTKISGAPVLGN